MTMLWKKIRLQSNSFLSAPGSFTNLCLPSSQYSSISAFQKVKYILIYMRIYMLAHRTAESVVQKESDVLLLNLFCASILYTQFILMFWLFSSKNRDPNPDPMLFNKIIKRACMTCLGCHQSVLNYPCSWY